MQFFLFLILMVTVIKAQPIPNTAPRNEPNPTHPKSQSQPSQTQPQNQPSPASQVNSAEQSLRKVLFWYSVASIVPATQKWGDYARGAHKWFSRQRQKRAFLTKERTFGSVAREAFTANPNLTRQLHHFASRRQLDDFVSCYDHEVVSVSDSAFISYLN